MGFFIFIFCACVEAYDNEEYHYYDKNKKNRYAEKSPFSVKSKMRFRGFGPWGGKKKRRE